MSCFLLLILIVFLIPLVWFNLYGQASKQVDKWANKNNYILLSKERRSSFFTINAGPFKLINNRNDVVFQITAKKIGDDVVRSGWIKIKIFWPFFKPTEIIKWNVDYDNFENSLNRDNFTVE